MHSTAPHKRGSKQPKDDGLWLIDIPTKQAKMLISIHDLSLRLYTGVFSKSRDPLTGLAYKSTTGTLGTSGMCYYTRPKLNAIGTNSMHCV